MELDNTMDSPGEDYTVTQLKTFISLNLEDSFWADPHSLDASEEFAPALTHSNVTQHDTIWMKESPRHPGGKSDIRQLSPPLKSLTPCFGESLTSPAWDTNYKLSDEDSEKSYSSQDTMIMMTTEESQNNQQRIEISLRDSTEHQDHPPLPPVAHARPPGVKERVPEDADVSCRAPPRLDRRQSWKLRRQDATGGSPRRVAIEEFPSHVDESRDRETSEESSVFDNYSSSATGQMSSVAQDSQYTKVMDTTDNVDQNDNSSLDIEEVGNEAVAKVQETRQKEVENVQPLVPSGPEAEPAGPHKTDEDKDDGYESPDALSSDTSSNSSAALPGQQDSSTQGSVGLHQAVEIASPDQQECARYGSLEELGLLSSPASSAVAANVSTSMPGREDLPIHAKALHQSPSPPPPYAVRNTGIRQVHFTSATQMAKNTPEDLHSEQSIHVDELHIHSEEPINSAVRSSRSNQGANATGSFPLVIVSAASGDSATTPRGERSAAVVTIPSPEVTREDGDEEASSAAYGRGLDQVGAVGILSNISTASSAAIKPELGSAQSKVGHLDCFGVAAGGWSGTAAGDSDGRWAAKPKAASNYLGLVVGVPVGGFKAMNDRLRRTQSERNITETQGQRNVKPPDDNSLEQRLRRLADVDSDNATGGGRFANNPAIQQPSVWSNRSSTHHLENDVRNVHHQHHFNYLSDTSADDLTSPRGRPRELYSPTYGCESLSHTGRDPWGDNDTVPGEGAAPSDEVGLTAYPGGREHEHAMYSDTPTSVTNIRHAGLMHHEPTGYQNSADHRIESTPQSRITAPSPARVLVPSQSPPPRDQRYSSNLRQPGLDYRPGGQLDTTAHLRQDLDRLPMTMPAADSQNPPYIGRLHQRNVTEDSSMSQSGHTQKVYQNDFRSHAFYQNIPTDKPPDGHGHGGGSSHSSTVHDVRAVGNANTAQHDTAMNHGSTGHPATEPNHRGMLTHDRFAQTPYHRGNYPPPVMNNAQLGYNEGRDSTFVPAVGNTGAQSRNTGVSNPPRSAHHWTAGDASATAKYTSSGALAEGQKYQLRPRAIPITAVQRTNSEMVPRSDLHRQTYLTQKAFLLSQKQALEAHANIIRSRMSMEPRSPTTSPTRSPVRSPTRSPIRSPNVSFDSSGSSGEKSPRREARGANQGWPQRHVVQDLTQPMSNGVQSVEVSNKERPNSPSEVPYAVKVGVNVLPSSLNVALSDLNTAFPDASSENSSTSSGVPPLNHRKNDRKVRFAEPVIFDDDDSSTEVGSQPSMILSAERADSVSEEKLRESFGKREYFHASVKTHGILPKATRPYVITAARNLPVEDNSRELHSGYHGYSSPTRYDGSHGSHVTADKEGAIVLQDVTASGYPPRSVSPLNTSPTEGPKQGDGYINPVQTMSVLHRITEIRRSKVINRPRAVKRRSANRNSGKPVDSIDGYMSDPGTRFPKQPDHPPPQLPPSASMALQDHREASSSSRSRDDMEIERKASLSQYQDILRPKNRQLSQSQSARRNIHSLPLDFLSPASTRSNQEQWQAASSPQGRRDIRSMPVEVEVQAGGRADHHPLPSHRAALEYQPVGRREVHYSMPPAKQYHTPAQEAFTNDTEARNSFHLQSEAAAYQSAVVRRGVHSLPPQSDPTGDNQHMQQTYRVPAKNISDYRPAEQSIIYDYPRSISNNSTFAGSSIHGFQSHPENTSHGLYPQNERPARTFGHGQPAFNSNPGPRDVYESNGRVYNTNSRRRDVVSGSFRRFDSRTLEPIDEPPAPLGDGYGYRSSDASGGTLTRSQTTGRHLAAPNNIIYQQLEQQQRTKHFLYTDY